MPESGSDAAVTCATIGHEKQRATRYVTCEGEGSYPYCDECATVLIRGGETDGGTTDDPVVAERDRLRADLAKSEQFTKDNARWDRRIKRALSKMRVAHWAMTSAGFAYHEALDDVWDALDQSNPHHDEIRCWITQRRKELSP